MSENAKHPVEIVDLVPLTEQSPYMKPLRLHYKQVRQAGWLVAADNFSILIDHISVSEWQTADMGLHQNA